MSNTLSKAFKIFLVVVIVVVGGVYISTKAHAHKMEQAGYTLDSIKNPDWAITSQLVNENNSKVKIQTAELDECLHCHISGSFENVWVPFTRWSVAGIVVLFAAFGITRSAWVWRNREGWMPVTTRLGNWVNERYQTEEALSKFLKKPVPNWSTRWWYCLGGITAFLFVIQAITGVMLAFYYQPTPEHAYSSIQYIENEVLFGASIRAIHHWSANGMIVMCVAHMLRVFIMGAFKSPRELNWVSGVILLITTLGFGFTGYLLPWDQRAYWATTVGTEIAGGIPDIGALILIFLRVGWGITETTLSRFYALHILVLPVLVIAMMGAHFIMIRRQGLMEPL